ncbi:MAG: hypothetical protein A2148_06145 [Chloroflexi bacterium RBG_16_68_14]|nr:MAG: hypothetical protein A2148_06145 [Chloroflexi bacterium RBG_16_68_14]
MAHDDLEPAAITVLESIPAALTQMLGSLPDEMAQLPLDDVWSAKDVVAHLIDARQAVFRERIGRMLAEDQPLIRPFDPSTRIEELGYRARSLASLLDELARDRAGDLNWLRSLTPEQRARTGQHEEAGKISVANLIYYWGCHELAHVAQIARMIRSPLAERVGNMTRYLDE